MIKHTYHVLEFYKLLHILADYASCPLGRSDCLSLKPSKDLKIIEKEQGLVSEMKLLLKMKGFFSFEGLTDIGHILETCRVEGFCLEPDKLLSIYRITEATDKAKNSILSQKVILPGLYYIVKEMVLHRELRESVNNAIHPNGTIRDSASKNLSKLRRKKRDLRRALQKKLEDIKGSIGLTSEKDDHPISIRDGRHVIPLPIDKKNSIQGIIHDYSRSRSTCFLEPIEVVQDNNRLAELAHLEKDEELRILTFLTTIVRNSAEDLISTQNILRKLDGLYARARFSNRLNGIRPIMGQDKVIDLRQALNPILIFLSTGTAPPVPLDILLDSNVNVMIISGPNRGGKTVTLKTLGLLSLMAQAGIHIPAGEGSRLPVFKNILAEIGDDQDIQTGQSTFSAHVGHLKYMTEHADQDSLIIIDEPGMGTDPDEGAALAMALLDDLARKNALVAVSTHYNRLKIYGLSKERVKNACMEFDSTVNLPTFFLRYGTPGTSYALEVAQKEGIRPDLLANAKRYLDHNEVRLNRLIDKLNSLKYETSLEKSEATRVKEKYHSAREKILKTLKKVESNKEAMLEKKRNEADLLIKEARKNFKKLINSLKEKKETSQAFVQKRYDQITERLVGDLTVSEERGKPGDKKILKKGQWVRHRRHHLEGKLVSLDIPNSKALIIAGNAKLSVNTADLIAVADDKTPESDRPIEGISYRHSVDTAREINLIGYRVEEALPLIDRMIDRSIIEGGLSLRIIHGHGTGKLKTAIREHLSNLSCVKSIGSEDPRSGGEAITVVELN